jgi:hypothetical protein
MSDLVLALVLVAVVAAMIISQVKGVTLSGRRMLLLPAILIGFGAVNLAGMHGVGSTDIACIAVSAAIAAAIVLGINRLAQSAMIGLRASRAGLPLGGPASRPAFTDGL